MELIVDVLVLLPVFQIVFDILGLEVATNPPIKKEVFWCNNTF